MYFLYRGEKLYVTKDNRSKPEGKGCRKCFCGTFGVIFLVAAIIVAGLVGGRVTMLNSRCFLCSRKTTLVSAGIIDPQPKHEALVKDGRSRDIENPDDPRLGGVFHPDAPNSNNLDDHHDHDHDHDHGHDHGHEVTFPEGSSK